MKLTKGATYERAVTIEAREAEGKPIYLASLSSETPVERVFGTEILQHTPDSIDLTRAARGLPLLFNHNQDEPLGKIRNLTIDGGKLRGELTFGRRAKALEIRDEIDAGMLGDMSIRYTIDEYETKTDEHGHDTVTVTRWGPLEGSVVTIPADPHVGVGRSRDTGVLTTKGANEMGDETETETGGRRGGDKAGKVNVAELTAARGRAKDEGRREAVAAERERVAGIEEVFELRRFTGEQFDLLRKQCLTDGRSVDEARSALLELIDGLPENQAEPTATRTQPDTQTRGRPGAPVSFQAGPSAEDKASLGIARAIEGRANLLSKEEQAAERTSEFRNLTLVELARAWAHASGFNVRGMSPMEMLGRIFTDGRMRSIGLGTEDFTGILANVAHKQLLRGWELAASTYRLWTRKGNLTDFKQSNRTGLSGYSLLQKVGQNSEIKHGKRTDRTEYITLETYAGIMSISRQAIINDDLGAFTDNPRVMGAAADRTVNKMLYDLLVSNSGTGPTLNQDSTVLFHTNHANYAATSGGITVTTLSAGRTAMRRQKDPQNSEVLNISPKYLIVPSTLETEGGVLVASEKDPDGRASATGGAMAANPFYNKLQVIVEPSLDDATNGTTAWYLAADQDMYDTFEVAFLNGNDAPYFETQNGFNVDGVELKVRIDAAAACLDYRGMYRKKGA